MEEWNIGTRRLQGQPVSREEDSASIGGSEQLHYRSIPLI